MSLPHSICQSSLANRFAWFVVAICLSPQVASGEPIVRFEMDEYEVTQNEDFIVRVVLDADSMAAGIQAFPDGLFSFGVRLIHSGNANLDDLGDIQAVSELNHFGFSPGALEDLGVGFAAVKGNIDQTGVITPHTGTLLAELELTNLGAPGSSYELQLESYVTLGPSEQVFVAGSGNVLDDELAFRSATVTVVPEPSSQTFLLLVVIGWFSFHKRCRTFAPAGK